MTQIFILNFYLDQNMFDFQNDFIGNPPQFSYYNIVNSFGFIFILQFCLNVIY